MKLVFSPSGKRVIPYPPVGIAILAAQLRGERIDTDVCDLEMELAARRADGQDCLIHRRKFDPREAVSAELDADVASYADLLWSFIGIRGSDPVGISVMGFDQVASALLVARTALEQGRRVIFGGQFWTQRSADEAMCMLAPFGRISVTIGDGWEAALAFAREGSAETIPNTVTSTGASMVAGPRITAKSLPPQPDYDWVDWGPYERFGSASYRDERRLRRAHLYVWDKQCNFRCAFCRVATGSRAALTSPQSAVDSFAGMGRFGVKQLNFMTNELNPSRTYLLRFLDQLERHQDEASDTDCNWFTYVRADRLERAELGRIRRLGGRFARYGVESGSQRLLDLMRKDYDVPTMAHTLRAAAAEALWNHVNLLVGFPGEEESDIDQTVGFLEQNAAAIHSVRINPFYLPPDTPIARAPEEFGIRLTEFDSGWWRYEGRDGEAPDEADVVRRIERIAQACAGLGIGFAGTDPFFLLNVISRFDAVEDAIAYLKQDYPLFWVPAPTDAYKAMIGGYSTSADWKDTSLKRQRNYSLSICTD